MGAWIGGTQRKCKGSHCGRCLAPITVLICLPADTSEVAGAGVMYRARYEQQAEQMGAKSKEPAIVAYACHRFRTSVWSIYVLASTASAWRFMPLHGAERCNTSDRPSQCSAPAAR